MADSARTDKGVILLAAKSTYIYKVMMGKHGDISETKYCYARNSDTAKKYYKQKFKDKNYDTFITVAFGDVDIKKYPEPISEMPDDEIKYIQSKNIGNAELYSNRKDNRNIPNNTEFIPVDKEI